VTYFHAYPGFVKTPLSQGLPWYARAAMSPLSVALGVSSEQCAEHLVYALLQPDVAAYKTGGACFVNEKGDAVKGKTIATESQQAKIKEHTDGIIGF
jgi:hypothetical protein